jgi:hypothetical protein
MFKPLVTVLCLCTLLPACGNKDKKKDAPPPAAPAGQALPPGPSGHAGKPDQVRQDVNDTLKQREAENERRLKEATGE